MFNSIAYGANELNLTASVTFGYAGGQQLPPRLLIMTAASGATIKLPPIITALPVPAAQPGTIVGTGGGFKITIRNGNSQPLTVVPTGTDTIADTLLLSSTGATETLQAHGTTGTWYKTVNPLGAGGSRSVAGAATIAASDRFLIISVASTVTLPAPSNFPTGVPFVTVLNTSGGSVTVAPASGTIQTTAALTIATLGKATIFTDGTNFYTSA